MFCPFILSDLQPVLIDLQDGKTAFKRNHFHLDQEKWKPSYNIMHLLQNKANKSTIKLPFTWQWKARRDFQVNLLHILCPKQSYFLDKLASSPCDTHIFRSFPYPPAWCPTTRGAGQLFWPAEGWSNRSQKQWCNTEVSSWWSTAHSLPLESQPRC